MIGPFLLFTIFYLFTVFFIILIVDLHFYVSNPQAPLWPVQGTCASQVVLQKCCKALCTTGGRILRSASQGA